MANHLSRYPTASRRKETMTRDPLSKLRPENLKRHSLRAFLCVTLSKSNVRKLVEVEMGVIVVPAIRSEMYLRVLKATHEKFKTRP